MILSDDYGWGSATCYGADPKLVQTPNIDRLAKEGRRFTDANTTSSVCSPTRYALLTGRYCWRTTLKHEVLGTTSPLHIEPGRLNLASLLKQRGFATAAIGKWHLGYGNDPKTDFTKELKPGPLEIGFDYHFGVPANHGDIAGVYVENHRVYGLRSTELQTKEKTVKNFKGVASLGLDAPQRVDEEVMPVLTKKAVEWIQSQNAKNPFFLYYTPVAIHNPVTPSAATKGSSAAGIYGDWIHELDRSVGAVLQALDDKGFAENTIVLFTSDNGGVNKPANASESTDAIKAGLKVSGPYRGGKHDVWEGGFHVPYLVRWPGRIPSGTTSQETISLVDTVATIAALLGEPLPARDVGAEDSVNMLPAWLGQAYTPPLRKDIILHSADGNFAIRRGPWKWIEGDYHPDTKIGVLRSRKDQFHPQLYNLVNDVAETKDVSGEHPEVAKELEQLLNRYRDGGFSRELPPEAASKPQEKPVPEVSGTVVRQDDFREALDSSWVKVRGDWNLREGVLRGTQGGGDAQVAALRAPLQLTDCLIEYELELPELATHSLRLQGAKQDVVFRIEVNGQRLAIVKQPSATEKQGNTVLASQRLKLVPGAWVKLRVVIQGDEIFATIDKQVVHAKHEDIALNKTAFALLVQGKQVGFRNLTVSKL